MALWASRRFFAGLEGNPPERRLKMLGEHKFFRKCSERSDSLYSAVFAHRFHFYSGDLGSFDRI